MIDSNKSKRKRGGIKKEKKTTRIGVMSNAVVEDRGTKAVDLPSLAATNSNSTNSGDNKRVLRSQTRNNEKLLRGRGRLMERSVLSELSSLQNLMNRNRDNNGKRAIVGKGIKMKKLKRKSQRPNKEKENEACNMMVIHQKKSSSRCNHFNTCVLECLPPMEQMSPPSTLPCASSTPPSRIEETSSPSCKGHTTTTTPISTTCNKSNSNNLCTIQVVSASKEVGLMKISMENCVDDFDIYSPSVAPRAAKRLDCKMTPLLCEIESADLRQTPLPSRVLAEASSPTCTKGDFHTTATISTKTPIATGCNPLKNNDHGAILVVSAGTMERPNKHDADGFDLYSPSVAPRATKRIDCKMTPILQEIQSPETCRSSIPRMVVEASSSSLTNTEEYHTTTPNVISSKKSSNTDQGAMEAVTSKDARATEISMNSCVDEVDIYSQSVASRTTKRIDINMTPLVYEKERAETYKSSTPRIPEEASSPSDLHDSFHSTTPIAPNCAQSNNSDQDATLAVGASKDGGMMETCKEHCVDDLDTYSPSVARTTNCMNGNLDRCDDLGQTIEFSPTKYDEISQSSRRKNQKLIIGMNLLLDINTAHSESFHDEDRTDDKSKDSTNSAKDEKVTKLCFDCQSLDGFSPLKSSELFHGDQSKPRKDAIKQVIIPGVEQAKSVQRDILPDIVDAQDSKTKNESGKLVELISSSAEPTEVSRIVRRSTRNAKPVNRFIATFRRSSKRRKSCTDDRFVNGDANKRSSSTHPSEEETSDTANNDSQTLLAETSTKSPALPTRRSTRVTQPVQRFTLNFKKKKKTTVRDEDRNDVDDKTVKSKINSNSVENNMKGKTVDGTESNDRDDVESQGVELESEKEDDIFDETPIKSNQDSARDTADVNSTKNNQCIRLNASSKRKVEKESNGIEDDSRINSSWPQKLVDMLKQAHSSANPMSSTFWNDIAESIEGKSAEECRDKWFDMFQPSDSLRKTLPNETQTDADDDIFNSTPLKAKSRDDYWLSPTSSKKESHKSNAFQKLSYLFSSPILQRRKGLRSAQDTEDEKSPLFLRLQYKTYLKEVRAGIHRKMANTNRSKKSVIPKVKKNCMVSLEEGDLELGGSLSPGGTVHIQAPEEEDLDDLYVGQCEYTDEDDVE
jgi:hypothetical protein